MIILSLSLKMFFVIPRLELCGRILMRTCCLPWLLTCRIDLADNALSLRYTHFRVSKKDSP